MAKKTQQAMIEVKLVKSLIGSKKNQLATARALGLRRIGDVTVQPDNDATRGKVRVLSHLLKVTEIEPPKPARKPRAKKADEDTQGGAEE